MNHRQRHAFTLIEVLVVVLVIGILIAILVPAVSLLRQSFLDTSTRNILKTTQHLMDEQTIITDGRVNRLWGWDQKAEEMDVKLESASESYGKYGQGGGAFGPIPEKYRGRIIDQHVNGNGQFYSSATFLFSTGLESVFSSGVAARDFKGSGELTLYMDSLRDSKAIQGVKRSYNGYSTNATIVDARGYPIQINYWITDADSIFPISDASYAASPGRDGQWGDATPDDNENNFDAWRNKDSMTRVWPWYNDIDQTKTPLYVIKSIEHYYDDFSPEAADDNVYSREEVKP